MCLTPFDLTTGSDSFPGAEEVAVAGLSCCRDDRWVDNDIELVGGTTLARLGKKWLMAIDYFRDSKSLSEKVPTMLPRMTPVILS